MKSFDLQHRQHGLCRENAAQYTTHIWRSSLIRLEEGTWEPRSHIQCFLLKAKTCGKVFCCRQNIQSNLRSLTQTILIVNDSPRKRGSVEKEAKKKKKKSWTRLWFLPTCSLWLTDKNCNFGSDAEPAVHFHSKNPIMAFTLPLHFHSGGFTRAAPGGIAV